MPLGEEAAAVAYHLTWEAEMGGKKQKMDTVDSTTWVKKGAGWEAAMNTETPAQA